MILSILNELNSTSSRNDKINILKKYKDVALLKRFFHLSLDPLINFYQKQIPIMSGTCDEEDHITLESAFTDLNNLSNRIVTGSEAKRYLSRILYHLSDSNREVLKLVIGKNPKCGVSGSTVNKIWGKNFIKKFPVSKAFPYSKKNASNIVFPAYSQTKLDCLRCQVVIDKEKVTLFSSAGREMNVLGAFDNMTKIFGDYNCVIDGELVVTDESDSSVIIDRKTGGGIINKAIKNTLSIREATRLKFIIFDMIPYEDWIKGSTEEIYEDSFNTLLLLKKTFDDNLGLVDCVEVNSMEDAISHFKELYAKGEEGTILKNKKMKWEPKRSKNMIKFKGILTTDLIVTDFIPGTGKHEGKIGSLCCESADGKLKVNVGSGLKDEDREKSFNFWKNSIVEVAYNEVIDNKGERETSSLFLPRLIEKRTDKLEADTMELIVKKEVNF